MAAGTLYVVATPLGNLEDITLRALRVLRQVDLIACEDTRHTRKLLERYDIRKPLESYYEQVEMAKSHKLANLLLAGRSVALVCDAGTPCISDPGYRLVKLCIEKGIKIVPIPGPTAFVAALSASGLPTDAFSFYGFLPARKTQRRKLLESLKRIDHTLIFYESPHRLLGALEDIRAVFGDRRAVVAREMTKVHEDFLRGALSELIALLSARSSIKGEITLIVEGFKGN